MKITKNKISTNITLSQDLFKALEEITTKKGMSRSSFVSMAVSNQIQAEKTMEDLPRTIEALKQLEREARERKEIEQIDN